MKTTSILENLEKSSLYEHRIIIDFTANFAGNVIGIAWSAREKILKKHSKSLKKEMTGVEFLSSKITLKELIKQAKKTGEPCKIYIVGHCLPGGNFIYPDDNPYFPNQKWDCNTIAQRLAEFIGNENVVINLVACSAARGKRTGAPEADESNSFAAKLHGKLKDNLNRDIPVIARRHVLSIGVDGRKSTVDLNMSHAEFTELKNKGEDETLKKANKHRQPGSKVIFSTTENNEQVSIDAYFHLWKRRVMKLLKASANHTSVKEKKLLLNNWINQFEAMPDKKIYKVLAAELKDMKSHLRDHSNFISRLWKIDPDSYKAMKELVEEWKNIKKSKFTFENISPTRKR